MRDARKAHRKAATKLDVRIYLAITNIIASFKYGLSQNYAHFRPPILIFAQHKLALWS